MRTRPTPRPRLARHLWFWLGAWPPARQRQVISSPNRARPGCDGAVRPAIEVADPAGRSVLSVPPAHLATVHSLVSRDAGDLWGRLPAIFGKPEPTSWRGVLRWTTDPKALPDAGTWEEWDGPHDDHVSVAWHGQVLVARDPSGAYLAGVRLKRHTPYGYELTVDTSDGHGQELTGRLVAQAARRALREGAVPWYVHDPENLDSAQVAEIAGLTDTGWSIRGLRGPTDDHQTADWGA